MTNYDLIEIVDKVNGDISPIGESYHDKEAFVSLKEIENFS